MTPFAAAWGANKFLMNSRLMAAGLKHKNQTDKTVLEKDRQLLETGYENAENIGQKFDL